LPSTVQSLAAKNLVKPPSFLLTNTHYETIMGSVAYGVSSDISDCDIYGFGIPPKTLVFPHLAGEIEGFGRQKKRFDQWIEHHILDPSAEGGKGRSYDIQIFSIVKYFSLAMENNPNMLDSLFTPANCVLHSTAVGELVRENRKMFLHKGAWPKFKGYAYSQLHKMSGKNPEGKRVEIREKYGFDVKFAYHVVRLLDEAEQILTLGDMDLQRAKEHLKAIRRGEVPEEEIRRWAAEKEHALEKAYAESKLPWGPDEPKIKQLLLDCLEHHYGTLENCIVQPDRFVQALREIAEVIDKHKEALEPNGISIRPVSGRIQE